MSEYANLLCWTGALVAACCIGVAIVVWLKRLDEFFTRQQNNDDNWI